MDEVNVSTTTAVSNVEYRSVNADEVLAEFGVINSEVDTEVRSVEDVNIIRPIEESTPSPLAHSDIEDAEELNAEDEEIEEESEDGGGVVDTADSLDELMDTLDESSSTTAASIPTPTSTTPSTASLASSETDALIASARALLDECAPKKEEKPDPRLIPKNEDVFNYKDEVSRFSGALWFEEVSKRSVIVAGQGGIGSWTSMILSRLHPASMFLYDDDTVEQANLSGQFYTTDNNGQTKVNAIAHLMKKFSNYRAVTAINERFTSNTGAADIMICGFDNMVARKTFFNAWEAHVEKSANKSECLFIDGRLSLNSIQIFCITGDDTFNMNRYAKDYLFSDDDAEPTLCSQKQTTYCASMIGSLICNLYVNFCANKADKVCYDLPFKTYYEATMMFLKTES